MATDEQNLSTFNLRHEFKPNSTGKTADPATLVNKSNESGVLFA